MSCLQLKSGAACSELRCESLLEITFGYYALYNHDTKDCEKFLINFPERQHFPVLHASSTVSRRVSIMSVKSLSAHCKPHLLCLYQMLLLAGGLALKCFTKKGSLCYRTLKLLK